MDLAFPKNNEAMFSKKKEAVAFMYKEKGKKGYVLSQKKVPQWIYKATGDDRKAFEQGPQIIFNLENTNIKDGIYSRRSGMNQVLAKIAKKNDTIIAFSYHLFSHATNQAVILGRMQQNYLLCKKYGVKTLVASFAETPEELQPDITLKAFERLLAKKKLF